MQCQRAELSIGGPAPSALCDDAGPGCLAGVLRSSSARSRSINGTERCKRRRAAIRAASSRAIRRCHRNETPSVVAVRVENPDRSPVGINRCDAAPTPTAGTELVGNQLPVFDAMRCATAALRRAITEMGTSASKICWPKNQKPPMSFPVFRCDACLRQRALIRHKPPHALRYPRRLPHSLAGTEVDNFRLHLDIVFDTVRRRVAPAIAIAAGRPFARTSCQFTTCNVLQSRLR